MWDSAVILYDQVIADEIYKGDDMCMCQKIWKQKSAVTDLKVEKSVQSLKEY